MLLFKRILDFKRAHFSRLRDKRRTERFPVAPGFPLKASVSLLGVDNPGLSKAPAGSGYSWGGAIADISGEGISLRLPPASASARGENTILTLSLDGGELRIPCSVAHFRIQGAEARCGLALKFTDEVQQKSYLQLIETVAIGARFTPAKAPKAKAGKPVAERYTSESKAVLTAWRPAADAKPERFELVIGDLRMTSEAGRPELRICAGADDDATPVTGLQRQEAFQLFRLVTANLSKDVAADLRSWMRMLAAPAPAPSRR